MKDKRKENHTITVVSLSIKFFGNLFWFESIINNRGSGALTLYWLIGHSARRNWSQPHTFRTYICLYSSMQRSAFSLLMFMKRLRRRIVSAITSLGTAMCGTFTVYLVRLLSSDTTHTHMITELSGEGGSREREIIRHCRRQVKKLPEKFSAQKLRTVSLVRNFPSINWKVHGHIIYTLTCLNNVKKSSKWT